MTTRPPQAGEGPKADEGPASWRRIGTRLVDGSARVRSERRLHAVSLFVCLLVGLALASVHWIGLVVGGALVGLVAPDLSRAVGYGLGFGVVVLVVFAVSLGGALGGALAMSPAIYLTVGAGLGLPVLGSLVRGVV